MRSPPDVREHHNPLVGGCVRRIDKKRWRWAPAGLLLAIIAGGGPACGETGDAEPARSADSRPSVTAGDGGVDDQEIGLRVDAEGGTVTREAEIRVGGSTVTVEIADDPDVRSRGLMNRDSLPEDHGMLFVYPEEQILSFWMRNTLIPLDIAFIDRNGFILEIQQMEPHDDASHASKQPAMYALELRKGWFEDHGVEPGERVEF
jgi:uncharacterized membrane protein (UPF0127 family)